MVPAAWAAIACFAAREIEPGATTEGAYLGRFAAAMLAAVAALAPAPARELGLGAALAVAAVWAFPAGPARGAALMALRAASFVVAATRRLGGLQAGAKRLGAAVALCFGAQILLRGELLFAPRLAAKPWLALLLLPLVAGAALTRLWNRRGAVPALAAAGAAIVLAPGWTVGTTLALAALAGGEALSAGAFSTAARRRGLGAPDGGRAVGEEDIGQWQRRESTPRLAPSKPSAATANAASSASAPVSGTEAASAASAASAEATSPASSSASASMASAAPAASTASPRLTALAALAALVAVAAPMAWEPRSGWVATLAGVALWRPRLAVGIALPLALVVRMVGLPGGLAAHASWREGALSAVWLSMLVPAALLAMLQAATRGYRLGSGAAGQGSVATGPSEDAAAAGGRGRLDAENALEQSAQPAASTDVRDDRGRRRARDAGAPGESGTRVAGGVRGGGTGVLGQREVWMFVAAALLAVATPWMPDRSALAGPVALAALILPAAGAAAGIAAVWSAGVLFGTALLASYPWMRADPLGDALALIGSGQLPGLRLGASIAGATLELGALTAFLWRFLASREERAALAGSPEVAPGAEPMRASKARRLAGLFGMAATRRGAAVGASAASPASPASPAPAGLAAAMAGGALFIALVSPFLMAPSSTLLVAGNTVLLDRSNPAWHREIGTGRTGSLVLQTSLVNAAELPAGTPVALLRLRATGGSDVTLLLRAGRDTGEWAARRPDQAGARLPAPRPWMSWVAGNFFGQRYRCRLPLPHPTSFGRLEIELAPNLPPDLGLALYQVELAP